MTLGVEELSDRAADLAGRLPEALAPLARIAFNYRWAWYPRGKEVFRAIDARRWQVCGENPVRLLQEVSSEALARAAGDAGLIARAVELEDAFATDLQRPFGGADCAGATGGVPVRGVRRASFAAGVLRRAGCSGR